MPNLHLKPEDVSPTNVFLRTASIKEAVAAIERGDQVIIGYDNEPPIHILTTRIALDQFFNQQ